MAGPMSNHGSIGWKVCFLEARHSGSWFTCSRNGRTMAGTCEGEHQNN